MPNNPQEATLGKGQVAGYIFTAPAGTALPTDSATPLDAAYKNNGYITEDGVTNSTDTDTTEVKDLNGNTVIKEVTSYAESYQFALLSVLNPDAAKTRYGAANVTGTLDAGITITHALPTDHFVTVIELAVTGGKKDRIVIPDASRSEFGDRKIAASDAQSYDVTLSANPWPDYATDDGVGTSREYIAVTASSGQ